MKKITTTVTLLLVLSVMLVSLPESGVVKAEPMTIVVPDDYSTIQNAIDNADEGDTIFVKNGTYYENVNVDKSIILIGESKETTIIDGGKSSDVVKIVHNRVNLTGFTLQNAFDPTHTPDPFAPSLVGGVKIVGAHHCNITGNIVKNNTQGILLHGSTQNIIFSNFITNNDDNGVLLYASANNNTISENNVTDNRRGITLQESVGFNTFYRNNVENNSLAGILHYRTSFDNSFVGNNITNNNIGVQIGGSARTIFHHNNFMNNTVQVSYTNPNSVPSLFWDNGEEGNYWDDYNGTDSDGNGIGDTPYIINENNQDNHPLMEPTVIPEFPQWIILPLLLVATLMTLIYKKRLPKNTKTSRETIHI
jgi:nitrous oxidase accessory protein